MSLSVEEDVGSANWNWTRSSTGGSGECNDCLKWKEEFENLLDSSDTCKKVTKKIPVFKSTAERVCNFTRNFFKKWIPKAENVSM